MKRSGLPQPSMAQVIAWNNRERKPIARTARPKRVGRKTKRDEAALSLGRAVVIARSGGRCEGPYIVGIHPNIGHGALHVHHRLPRGRGGNHDPENLLHICPTLHVWIHDHPAEAMELDLLRTRVVS